jgi:serine/threonine protein kinase
LFHELYAATLNDYISGKYKGPMPDDFDALLQMATGVQYLHSKNYAHRYIEPSNILIFEPTRDDRVFLKISGISNRMRGVGKHTYVAPEKLMKTTEGISIMMPVFKTASDVFSLGCVFYEFLTRGSHPFGDGSSEKILEGKFLLDSKILHSSETLSLRVKILQTYRVTF